ncbi:efflux RND transporter periplasmic adaptor subunit [Sphingopyxis sp. YF1]|uniref:efflux RND transporter periplasmic adaptor subunit n=1 Tax=Sphingopyxis sp. YF1 TaxID=2482763 RepID=UPI001F61B3C2|nr:efflux RND transporter periplasmic adaptor subunit [Sphingopyxis sp. YF1]UNU42106.1 efflux RND transporter periplasmic adaptor subunit [Sphingopyxis sp. YF1]
MASKTKWFVGALAGLLLALTAVWLLAPRDEDVPVLTVTVAPAERVLALNGRVRPRLEIDIRPTAGGELVALPFDVGDRVSQGQILARIDDGPETAAITEAEASVQTQRAVVAQARRDLARFEALGQFTTRREVEQRRLAVTEGDRELKRREASVVQARELRDRRTLRAPFSGVILERPVDPGQAVGAESVIYRLADLANPEIRIEVDELYSTTIRPGMAAKVMIPELGMRTARVAHVEPRIDPETGAREVRLRLDAADVVVPSGLTVSVDLTIERRERAISIPRSAIVQAADGARVRLLGRDGVVAERSVRFIDWPSEKVIVTAGLSAGERILLDPSAAAPGDKVRAAD